MAEIVILERRCDNHLRLDQRETTELTFNHNIQIDAARPRHLDLCDECAGALTLAQLVDLLRDVGNPAETRSKRRKPAAASRPEIEPADLPQLTPTRRRGAAASKEAAQLAAVV
jgi:hypothetical protein